MASTYPGTARFALVDALNAEWALLRDDPARAGYGRAEIRRWPTIHPALAGCATPADVLAAIRADPDPLLGALIAVHQDSRRPGSAAGPGGQELAARIVLQTMLGKLVTMARRDRRHAVEDYVGRLWERIGTYPLNRRPRRIAANLALDTLKAVTRDRADIERNGGWIPCPTTDLDRTGMRLLNAGDVGDTADLTARRVLRSAQQLGLIDDATRRLLWSVYADGLTSAEAAARHRLSPATVRFRCSRAIRTLARHSGRLTDAA